MAKSSADKQPVLKSALILDPCTESAQSLQKDLEAKEVRVQTVTTTAEARAILEETNFDFDALIMEIDLPDGSGELFLEWVKLQSPFLSVIIVSGAKSDAVLIRCLNKGASDFIEKPYKNEQLISAAVQSLRRRSQQEAPGEMQAEIHASDWIELTAQTEIEYLGRIQRFSEVLFSRRLPQKVVDDLRLAMEEFGRNAVEWGNKFSREKQFRISYCFFPDRVVLKFEDEGEGFNPKSVPDPSQDPIAHLKRRQAEGKRPGGFGLFMMNRIMDEIFYNERGNVCIMTKYLPKDKDSAGD